MKAIRVHQTGGPEVLQFEDVPDPAPGPGDAVVKIEAAGVNFIDIYFRGGLYKTNLPLRTARKEPAWLAQWDRMSASSNPATA